MPSLTKKPSSRFWFACFRGLDGKQHRRSTFETDHRKALKIALEYERAATGELDQRSARETIIKLYRQRYSQGLTVATVRQFITRWLNEKRVGVAPATFERYEQSARKLLNFLGARADHDLNAISRQALVEFRSSISKGLAPGTANLVLAHVRMIFKAAKRDNCTLENAAEFLDPVHKGSSEGRRPFTIPEIQRVLELADPEWRSLILCGFYTGQRLSDLALLTWDNVDLVRGEIRLKTRKTGKRLILPIAGPLKKHLEDLCGSDVPGAPLHPRAFGVVSSQGRSGTLSNRFVALLEQAGFRDKKIKSSGKGRAAQARREQSIVSFLEAHGRLAT